MNVENQAIIIEILNKLIEFKEIPEQNLLFSFDEQKLEEIYDEITERFNTAIEEKIKVPNYLIILDDISFSGDLKKRQNGILSKMMSNGRHINLSVIMTAQKYSDIFTAGRENMTQLFCFACSNKQMDLIGMDVNVLSTNEFNKIFRKSTEIKHNFFGVNFFKNSNEMFFNSDFETI